MRRTWWMRIGVTALALGLWAGSAAAQGCGPGPIVFGSNKGIVQQTLAITTNIILLPIHTLAVTFGTSGCSNSGVVKREYEQQVYVAVNFEPLAADMARGTGEHLTVMAELMGCDRALRDDFAAAMRDELEPYLDHWENPWEAGPALRQALAGRPALAGCTRLS